MPSSPTTETIYAVNPGSSAIEAGAAASNAVTTIITNSIVSTETVSIIQTISTAGVYSFTEDNGTTTWLSGQTPSALSFLTITTFITLQPVITLDSSVSEGESAQSTSYLTQTLSPTITITETSTHTLTKTTSSAFWAAAGAYTGLAPNGWNATTLISVKAGATAGGSVKPSPYESASLRGTASLSANFSRKSIRLLKARQIEDLIGSTIDDVVVSWANNYDGSAPSTPEATSSTSEASHTLVPVTAAIPTFGPVSTSKCFACSFLCSSILTFSATSISPPSEVAFSTSEASHTFVPVTATAPAFGLISASECCQCCIIWYICLSSSSNICSAF